MPTRSIDLADPGSDGPRLAEHFRARGLEVRERSIRDLREGGSEAALVILAGDAEGALDALRALRRVSTTATLPVILVGGPDDGDLSAGGVVALGADAYYPRPVPLDRITRKVETYLSPSESRLRPRASGEAAPSGPIREPTLQLRDKAPDTWNPPERTLQLAEERKRGGASENTGSEEISVAPANVHPPPTHASVAPISTRPSAPGAAPLSGEVAVELSPRLEKLMLDADRRVFPTSTPISVRFPPGDESARQLVPLELLEVISLPLEPVREDPLEAFTYIGASPVHDGAAADNSGPQWLSTPGEALEDTSYASPMTGEMVVGSPAHGPRTETRATDGAQLTPIPLTQDEIGIGERTDGGRGRTGPLGEGDVLRLLWRAAELGYDTRVDLSLQDGPLLRLRIADGEFRAFDGPVALRVLSGLRRDGRVVERAEGEEEAVAILERRVEAGQLGRFELDRMLRRAREELLHDAIESMGGRFVMSPVLDAPLITGRMLASSVKASLVEGARRRLTMARVRRLLGSGALTIRLLHRGAERALAGAALEPELWALVERHEGAPLDRLLSAAGSEVGLPGALFALVSAGLVALVAAEGVQPRDDDPTHAIVAAVEASAALAADGDYFAILGVRPHAGTREIRSARDERVRELGSFDLSALRLDRLEPLRAEALLAVEEAFELLRDERLRERYRRSQGL